EERDPHKISELASEGLNALIEPGQVGFNLQSKQRLHTIVRELSSKFSYSSRWVGEETSNGGPNPSFRSRAFKEDDVKDFDLVKVVTLRFEESPTLLDSGLHYRIVVVSKRN